MFLIRKLLLLRLVKEICAIMRKFWKIVAFLSGIYIFIPEFTDVIPIIGWLDEATAFGIMVYSLKQLGIDIRNPFASRKPSVSKSLLS
jgi:hypothetical protein